MAPILTERVTWKKPKPEHPRYTPDLTAEEIANVKRAIKVLRARFGGYAALAIAMGAKRRTIELSMGPRRKPSAGLALRAARLAGVPVEEILSGAWPMPGSCPMCGRCS